jgi:NAD(P)-dependent dehydrogenase (short-subunit alcohol dehydrogenase family)
MTLTGKRAVVTGASSGIGLAIACRLAAAGARIALVGYEAEALESAREGLPGSGHVSVAADIRSRSEMGLARNAIEAAFGALEIVVANAGVNVRAPFLELGDDDMQRILDTNVYGTAVTLQVFAPLVLDRPGGRFVLTSSIAAQMGMDLRTVYTATKAGVAASSGRPSSRSTWRPIPSVSHRRSRTPRWAGSVSPRMWPRWRCSSPRKRPGS